MYSEVEIILMAAFGLVALISFILYKKRTESPEIQEKRRKEILDRAAAYRDRQSIENEIREDIENSDLTDDEMYTMENEEPEPVPETKPEAKEEPQTVDDGGGMDYSDDSE